jgi:hypothetical protein
VQLAAAGRELDALRLRLLLARAAATDGSPDTADRELAAAGSLDRRGTFADRIALRYVGALAHLRRGNFAAARRSLAAGLRLLEDHRATFAAIEVRAAVSALGEELCREGVALAVRSGQAAEALDWAERLRANALRDPVARLPQNRTLRLQQAELRQVARELGHARGARVGELVRRRSELESTIRARARLVRGAGASSSRGSGASLTLLRGHVLIEFLEIDGRIAAVTRVRGRSTLHDLADEHDMQAELDWLRLGLRRLAANRRADRSGVDAAAATLDRLLVAPLLDAVRGEAIIVVPTASLHALPWGLLPSLRGRVVTVAPSLRLWLRLAGQRRYGRRLGKTVLVAGPRLRHAGPEVHALAALHPDAEVLVGGGATAPAVLAALDGADLAHVACHGRFRADAPLFSSLELADGPLTALDLQGMRRPPEVLVLSACDLALSDRRPGDELLGMAAAVLAMGTRTVVASVVPVHDAGSRRLMTAFHQELLDASPATALARAQENAALAGFVCLGSG